MTSDTRNTAFSRKGKLADMSACGTRLGYGDVWNLQIPNQQDGMPCMTYAAFGSPSVPCKLL